MLIRLLRYFLRSYRGMLVVLVGLQAIQAIAALTLPRLTADLVDRGVMRGDTDHVWAVGSVMLVFTAVQLAFALLAIHVGSRIATGFGRDVRAALFHRVTEFSTKETNTFGVPSLINRITNDVQQVQLMLVMTCTQGVAAPITAVGGVFMAVQQDIGLSWVLAVSIPALVISAGSLTARMTRHSRLMQKRVDTINGVLREQLSGIRVVRAFVREPLETHRFRRANEDLTQSYVLTGRITAAFVPIVQLITNGSSVALVWLAGDRIAEGQTSVGGLIAFLTYFALILMGVMTSTVTLAMWPRAAVSAERIQEVFDTEPSVPPPSNPVRALSDVGGIEFRDVTFGYSGAEAPVLSGISFRTFPGQTTAIIGSTGSGKSTLVNLAARLFDVTGGAVHLSGVDVRDLDLPLLRSRIGLVPQRPFVFSGSVRTNLRYGKPDATDGELWTALQVAQAADFVAAMPGGLDAAIDQGGTNLSGGQRQRLSIARALIGRPRVYLFDDSFSALDVATAARLRAALVPVAAGAAILLVAQRVSTIRNADQILVLDDGLVVGLGTHDELLRSCPTYVEIVDSQSSERGAA